MTYILTTCTLCILYAQILSVFIWYIYIYIYIACIYIYIYYVHMLSYWHTLHSQHTESSRPSDPGARFQDVLCVISVGIFFVCFQISVWDRTVRFNRINRISVWDFLFRVISVSVGLFCEGPLLNHETSSSTALHWMVEYLGNIVVSWG